VVDETGHGDTIPWQGSRVLPRNRVLIVCVVGLACALSGVTWTWWSRATADRVTMTWAGTPACTGTEVHTDRSTPVIEAVKGMRCVVEVVVHNGSGRSVRLEHADAAYLGPDSGAVVRAAPTDLLDGATNDGLDARYRLDRDLAAGQDRAFEVVVAFRPQGCNEDGTLTFYGWPTLELTALGRTHRVVADRDFSFHRDGVTPGCRQS
jgi:hypothetical protein